MKQSQKKWQDRVADLRSKLKLSQDEFADLLGLQTRGAISLLESGKRTPKGPLKRLISAIEKNPNNFGVSC